MKVKFKKHVTADYFSKQSLEWEWDGKSFSCGEVVEVKSLENVSGTWADLMFDNGDMAIDIPLKSFELC